MLTKAYIKLLTAKMALADKLKEEAGEVNIVAMVILIGIAVLLALIFRDSIERLVTSLLNNIESSAQQAVSPAE